MSTFAKRTIAIFFAFFLLIFAAPYLVVNIKWVQGIVFNRLSEAVDGKTEIEGLEWNWLPQPAVRLQRVAFSNEMLRVTVPSASIHLGFAAALTGQLEVDIQLERPDIIVSTLKKAGSSTESEVTTEKKTGYTLPAITVNVTDGHILLPSDGLLEGLANHKPPIEIFELDATVAAESGTIDIKSSCRLTFIEKLNAEVRFAQKKIKDALHPNIYWEIATNGTNFNLTEAVEKVKLLFGENPTAKTVCNIVRGGHAASGGFAFKGFTEDFSKLEAMVITAEPTNARIQVPGLELNLTEASGPITIKDAILTGEGLSATIGNSFGKNGILKLDLGDQSSDFQLALDLDADISELPTLLKNNLLKNNDSVVKALAKISKATGRARAKLKIGDNLDDMLVTIVIDESDCSTNYGALRYPFGIKRGVLEFSADQFVWRDASITVGPHAIQKTDGSVNWKKGIRLKVVKGDANIHAKALFEELQTWPAVKKELDPLLRSISGDARIRDVKIEGLLSDSKNLVYGLSITVNTLSLDSPLLPRRASATNIKARVGNQKITISPFRLDMGNQHLALEVDLDHAYGKPYAGKIVVAGRVGSDLGAWLKDKKWIPALYFPRTPCRVDPMKVSFTNNTISVQGNLVVGQKKEGVTKTAIDLEITPEHFVLRDLTIQSPSEKVSMHLNLDRSDDRKLEIRFDGQIQPETLSRVLEKNRLLSGKIAGDFDFTYLVNKPDRTHFNGVFEMSGFALHQTDNVIRVDRAKIVGKETFVGIEGVDLRLNEEVVAAAGKVSLLPSGIDLDLDLNADQITSANLQKIYRAFDSDVPVSEELKAKDKAGRSPALGTKTFPGAPVVGNIRFACNKFIYQPEDFKEWSSDRDYVWDDLKGSIRLGPDGEAGVTISSGVICGLETTGTISKPPEITTLKGSIGQVTKADLKEFVRCFGLENSLATGQFSLDAAIIGVPENWDDGHFVLSAENGILKDFEALSKILTIINFTELFSIDRIKSFFSKGYPYSTIRATGKVSNNKMIIEEAYIIGDGLDFFLKGTIDVPQKEMDITVYIKPLKTVDSIVSIIPIIGRNLGGEHESVSLIPIKVGGKLGEPDVSFIRRRVRDDSGFIRDVLKKTLAIPGRVAGSVLRE